MDIIHHALAKDFEQQPGWNQLRVMEVVNICLFFQCSFENLPDRGCHSLKPFCRFRHRMNSDTIQCWLMAIMRYNQRHFIIGSSQGPAFLTKNSNVERRVNGCEMYNFAT